MIRVSICHVSQMLKGGLEKILSEAIDVTIVGTQKNGAEALAFLRAEQPDVLMVGQTLSDMSGVEIAQVAREKHYRSRIVMIATRMVARDVICALRKGISGIITPEMPALQINTCVRSVFAGHTWLDTPVANGALSTMLRDQHSSEFYGQKLTRQELAIARLVAGGLSNKDIARNLKIREGTVKLHLHHVYQKLEVTNRVALAMHVHDAVLGMPLAESAMCEDAGVRKERMKLWQQTA